MTLTYLRISKVHRFVHELVDQSHVVSHVRLIKVFAQVCFEDLDKLKEVLKDEGGIDV